MLTTPEYEEITRSILNNPLEGYPIKNGKPHLRYADTAPYIGRVDYYIIPPKMASFITDILFEMSKKCKRFNIPMLRGIVVMNEDMKKNISASMGDGILRMSYTSLMDAYTREQYNHLYNPTSTWKRGMPRKYRPYLSTFYFKDWREIISSIIWHEFGHHIHHTYLTNLLSPSSSETYFLYCKMPPLEQRILDTPRSGKKNHLATKYGARRPLEWWAENFTLYTMGRKDLVSKSFYKIIEDLENNNLPSFYSASEELNCLLNMENKISNLEY